MRIIGLLKLRNGKVRTLGEPWLDERGNQLYATVDTVKLNAEEWFRQTGERLTVPTNLKDGLPIILTGIDYVPETEVEIYEKTNLEETQKTPALYRLFGFIPFFNEHNQMVGGVPHRDVDTIWASDVESYREAWDIKSVFLACRSLTEGDLDDDEDDEDDEEEPEEKRAENGQQPSQTT